MATKCPPPDPVYVLRGANEAVASVDFLCPRGDSLTKHLVAGTQEGRILIWDLKSKGVKSKWIGHENSSVLWLKSISPDKLWSMGRSNDIKMWDIETNNAIITSSYPLTQYLGFSMCDLVTLEDRNTLLVTPGPEQNGISVWDTEKQYKISSLFYDANKQGNVMQVKWIKHSNKAYVLTAYESGVLCIWDWSNKQVITELSIGDTPMCLEYDFLNKKGICGTVSEKLFVFSVSDDLKLSHFKDLSIINPGISSCISRPDGKIYATGGWDYRIRLFSWKTHKPLAVLIYHKETVQCLAYSTISTEQFGPGNLLAAGSMDQSISLWSVYN